MPPVVFLPGLGQNEASWAGVRSRLTETQSFVVENRLDPEYGFRTAAEHLRDVLDARGIERATVCGLSLGAMVAVQFAASYPERVDRLVLSGGQVRPVQLTMHVQNSALRMVPRALIARSGLEKRGMIAAMEAIRRADQRPLLTAIAAPTLVLCGRRDYANLRAARQTARLVTGAELRVVPRVGHPWNVTHPARFADHVHRFLLQGSPRPAA